MKEKIKKCYVILLKGHRLQFFDDICQFFITILVYMFLYLRLRAYLFSFYKNKDAQYL